MAKEKIQAYISPETKKALARRAKTENRSVSNMAGLILDEAFAGEKTLLYGRDHNKPIAEVKL